MSNLTEATQAGGKRMTTFGVIAIILGLLAMLAPGLTGVSIAMLLGGLVVVSGPFLYRLIPFPYTVAPFLYRVTPIPYTVVPFLYTVAPFLYTVIPFLYTVTPILYTESFGAFIIH